MADQPRPVPAGMVLLRHPERVGCSVGGIAYAPDATGCVLVPIDAAPDLGTHGFAAVSADEPASTETAPDPRDAEIARLKDDLDQALGRLAAEAARADAAEAALEAAGGGDVGAQPPAGGRKSKASVG
jgi:hypothetical protein